MRILEVEASVQGTHSQPVRVREVAGAQRQGSVRTANGRVGLRLVGEVGGRGTRHLSLDLLCDVAQTLGKSFAVLAYVQRASALRRGTGWRES